MMCSLFLLVTILEVAETTKAYSLPYQVEPGSDCQDPKTEYLMDGLNLCCSRCPPGTRLLRNCNNTTDSVCKPCQHGQYMEDWNYYLNCFSCPRCKSEKGLKFAQSCSTTIKSTCMCRPGMYCVLGFDDPHCEECRKYTSCRPGHGVVKQGTAVSNVKCAPCPREMFSDKSSYDASCQPHSKCHGGAVVKWGDAFSDTVCEPLALSQTRMPQIPPTQQQALSMSTTVSPLTSRLSSGSSSTPPASSSVSAAMVSEPTKSLLQGTDWKTVAIISSVFGPLLIIIIVVVLLRRCRIQKEESEFAFPKVEANGNCKEGDNNYQVYLLDDQLASSPIHSLEQECLLKTEDKHRSLNLGFHDIEPLRRDDCCGQGCMATTAIPSKVTLNNTQSLLSEPMTLLSMIDPISPELVTPQPTSQPTSPQLISPATANPHVNVNITFHIRNGSCGGPSIIPTDSTQTNPDLPVGKEEECCSTPQQEDGKESLIAVQESFSCD